MKISLLSAGIVAATMMAATPVLAQEATQEPGAMGFYYPDTNYRLGGYGHRATPREGYYFRPHAMGEQGALPTYRRPVPYYGYGGPGYY